MLDPLPVDGSVASAWAELRVALRDAGRRMPVNDSWIAATAIANGLAVVTQDDDYEGVPGLTVLRA
jgi:predicted nucleic acid-binding protein